MRKRDFLNAFIWVFGVTRKEALAVWEKAKNDAEYVDIIIEAWKSNAERTFYCD